MSKEDKIGSEEIISKKDVMKYTKMCLHLLESSKLTNGQVLVVVGNIFANVVIQCCEDFEDIEDYFEKLREEYGKKRFSNKADDRADSQEFKGLPASEPNA